MAGAAALPLVGGFVGAAGAAQAAEAKAAAANYNAAQNIQNADFVHQQTAEQVRMQQVSAAGQIGEARADYGSSGVESTSGSALDVLRSSAASATMDALNIKNAGDRKEWALKSGAALDVAQAGQDHIAGNYGVATQIFGGGAGAANAGLFDKS